MTTGTRALPTSVNEWISELSWRIGWREFAAVGASTLEGVRAWTEHEGEHGAWGVWGNVVEPEDGEPFVNWAVYEGDGRDPVEQGLESAESAMAYVEAIRYELFL